MKRTSWIAGALSLALLAGCGAAGQNEQAAEDDLTYQILGVTGDSEIATINGESLTAGQYMFMLITGVEQWRLTPEDDWTQVIDEEEGLTVSDYVKEDALNTAKLHLLIGAKAKELGYTISEEEQTQFDQAYASYVEGMGGQEKLQEWITSYCITEEDFLEYNRAALYNNGVITKLTESGELDVTDQDVEDYIEKRGLYGAKHILISTRRMNEDGSYEEFTQDERNAALEEAKALRAQIVSAEDVNAEFDKVMNQRSDDGRDSDGNLYAPEGYQAVRPGDMVSSFEEGALALEEGAVSEPIQSPFGYHIIMRIPVDRATAKETCAQENYKYDAVLRQWLEEAEVTTTKVYDELDPKTAFESWQTIMTERAAAEATPAPSALPESSAQPETSPEPQK